LRCFARFPTPKLKDDSSMKNLLGLQCVELGSLTLGFKRSKEEQAATCAAERSLILLGTVPDALAFVGTTTFKMLVQLALITRNKPQRALNIVPGPIRIRFTMMNVGPTCVAATFQTLKLESVKQPRHTVGQ